MFWPEVFRRGCRRYQEEDCRSIFVHNLASAVAGETHEYTDMYPGMARTAREEGFDEIADWFETLAKYVNICRYFEVF